MSAVGLGCTRKGCEHSSAKLRRLASLAIGQEFTKRDDDVLSHEDSRMPVGGINLSDHFAAAAARGTDSSVTAHRDDPGDPGFAVLEHVRNGCMLSAKSKARAGVDA